ncbi:MAG: CoA transferase [Actinomycetia bacterium]|nr:CoA transferase [Actinomycetes bacterium]MCP3912196.1 CoA transferase [Actinomycetes bacterium]MCP4088071.1 CoA transferase [Actinomycetes bacterium]
MGPLEGVTILELWCIGPGPFAAMLLADMGANVIRVDRPAEPEYGYPDNKYRTLYRNRRAVTIDLDQPEGIEAFMRLVEQADGLIEGNRPGVCEKLGVGPDDCLARNPALVYGRMTGFGQDGPLAQQAGFDLSYISLTGVASSVGTPEQPLPPLILGGDFGGGGTYLALGMLAGIMSARQTGAGQVVDAAMVDGSASLMAYMYGGLPTGFWRNQRGNNTVDGGHWLYRMYRCADDKFVSVACLSPRLYLNFEGAMGLDPAEFGFHRPRTDWPELAEKLAAIIVTKSRDEWIAAVAGQDACVQPVLDMQEAPHHPHLVARGTFVEHGGVTQPAPAPRFSGTPTEIQRQPPEHGEHTQDVLTEFGFSASEIDALRSGRVITNREDGE